LICTLLDMYATGYVRYLICTLLDMYVTWCVRYLICTLFDMYVCYRDWLFYSTQNVYLIYSTIKKKHKSTLNVELDIYCWQLVLMLFLLLLLLVAHRCVGTCIPYNLYTIKRRSFHYVRQKDVPPFVLIFLDHCLYVAHFTSK